MERNIHFNTSTTELQGHYTLTMKFTSTGFEYIQQRKVPIYMLSFYTTGKVYVISENESPPIPLSLSYHSCCCNLSGLSVIR